jgi:hypothetical protein
MKPKDINEMIEAVNDQNKTRPQKPKSVPTNARQLKHEFRGQY